MKIEKEGDNEKTMQDKYKLTRSGTKSIYVTNEITKVALEQLKTVMTGS